MNKLVLFCALIAGPLAAAHGQIQRTSIPMKDALTKALDKSNLTGPEAKPFHIRISVSEPKFPESPYQGSIEEWWVSPQQWRREVTAKDGSRQTIVMADGKKTEEDTGDYLPLWLQSFVMAAFDPVPDAAAWSAAGAQIQQITMPNGAKSDACARGQGSVGSGERASLVFSSVCFDGDGRVNLYVSPRYGMEFHDYRGFGKKQFPRQFVDDPESGTTIVGEVTVLEDESKAKSPAALFMPLSRDDNAFDSLQVSPAQLEQLTAADAIAWPTVRAGKVQGHLAIYISVDKTGQVREAWPHNSDNGELSDAVREQAQRWKLKPFLDKNGNPVQIDGGLGFSFQTKIANALPELTDAEVRALATKTVEPKWPAGLKSGTVLEALIDVNEEGKFVYVGFHASSELLAAELAVNDALKQWVFHPLIRDGKPQYFKATVRFTVP